MDVSVEMLLIEDHIQTRVQLHCNNLHGESAERCGALRSAALFLAKQGVEKRWNDGAYARSVSDPLVPNPVRGSASENDGVVHYPCAE